MFNYVIVLIMIRLVNWKVCTKWELDECEWSGDVCARCSVSCKYFQVTTFPVEVTDYFLELMFNVLLRFATCFLDSCFLLGFLSPSLVHQPVCFRTLAGLPVVRQSILVCVLPSRWVSPLGISIIYIYLLYIRNYARFIYSYYNYCSIYYVQVETCRIAIGCFLTAFTHLSQNKTNFKISKNFQIFSMLRFLSKRLSVKCVL